MMILFEDKGWTINKLNRADHPQVKEQFTEEDFISFPPSY